MRMIVKILGLLSLSALVVVVIFVFAHSPAISAFGNTTSCPAYAFQYPLAGTNRQVLAKVQINANNPRETWVVYSEGALMDGIGVTGVKSAVFKAELLPEIR